MERACERCKCADDAPRAVLEQRKQMHHEYRIEARGRIDAVIPRHIRIDAPWLAEQLQNVIGMSAREEIRPNVNGVPYASTSELSHSSTLRTMQEIFHVDPQTGYPWLGAAATAADLSDIFRPGVIN